MTTFDKILVFVKSLFPTGRAWRFPFSGWGDKVNVAMSDSFAKTYDDAVSTLDSLLPDNDNFSSDDATDWERRLALNTDLSLSLATRKSIIAERLRFPGLNPAKSYYLTLEQKLQAAGFNVYVHENIIELYPSGYDTYNPASVNAGIFTIVQQGDIQQGYSQQKGYINAVVANSLDNEVDIGFDIGSNLKATFFIGGSVFGTYANVPSSREVEFRQLILKYKGLHNVAYLFINYV